jgi:hypothetical protein
MTSLELGAGWRLWVDSRLLPAKFRLVAIYELMRHERQRSNLNLP